MKFNQQVLLKHKYGITAQWISDDFSCTAIATYQQNEIKTKNSDGEEVIVKNGLSLIVAVHGLERAKMVRV
jgi:hypothetical protein